MAIVSAVAVPREPNRSGTTTKSVEAGVTHDSVRRVPPTTPMERLSFWGLSAASAAASSTGRSVSVMRLPIDSCGGDSGGSVIASGGWRRTSFLSLPTLHGTPTKTNASMGVYLRNSLIRRPHDHAFSTFHRDFPAFDPYGNRRAGGKKSAAPMSVGPSRVSDHNRHTVIQGWGHMKLRHTAAWVACTTAALLATSACGAEGAKTAAKTV